MSHFTAIIQSIKDEADGVKTFVLKKPEGFAFKPGQYCWVSLPDHKSAPMAIASGTNHETLEFSIRAWGDLTNALFDKSVGDTIEIDGAHGIPFPVEKIMEGSKLHMIGGGTGITPIRSLTNTLAGLGDKYVYYGAKSPDELLYRDELETWDAKVQITVDQADDNWMGSTGLVTSLLDQADFDTSDIFFVCGPKPMEMAVVNYLRDRNIEEENIYVSLEKFDAEGNVIGPVLPVTADEVEF